MRSADPNFEIDWNEFMYGSRHDSHVEVSDCITFQYAYGICFISFVIASSSVFSVVPRGQWGQLPSRMVKNVERVEYR